MIPVAWKSQQYGDSTQRGPISCVTTLQKAEEKMSMCSDARMHAHT